MRERRSVRLCQCVQGALNVGFFRGAELADPERLLEGTGRFMRHVKLRPSEDVNTGALTGLIRTAYDDIKRRLEAESEHDRNRERAGE